MSKATLTILLLFVVLTSCGQDKEIQNLNRLASVMIPGQQNNIYFEKVAGETDAYRFESKDGKLNIRGNNGVSMARALNEYMRNYLYATTSWNGDNIKHPDVLPETGAPVSNKAALPLRYYLNYCTYSYSMAFWSWEQWEQEIDRMALQGINMPLVSVIGQHAVWQNTLKRLGYSEEEIFAFLPGPGYEAWWLMGNLEGFGGPVSQSFIDKQADLQKKILNRMREYGMEPVFQGFYGMVPNSLIKKYPDSDIRDIGEWITYQRPAFLVPTDPLFPQIAEVYYEEQEKLFGKAMYYGGDPFHEGGNSKNVDIGKAGAAIYAAMQKHEPQAKWILQGWGHNPSAALMKALKPDQAIILDLMACARPQWGGVPTSVSHKQEGYFDLPWIWCALVNFGGRIGMYGKLDSYATGVVEAARHPMGKNVCGIGTTPEGIGTNPIDYNMVYDMAWRNESIEVSDWISNYTRYRYGASNSSAVKAWEILAATIYNCPTHYDGPQESYLCARPALHIPRVSSWGTAQLYYDPAQPATALKHLISASGEFKNVDTYRYDLVDLTRQVLADYSKSLHRQIAEAYKDKNVKDLSTYSAQFLELIDDQDKLLSTRKEFLTGTWTNAALNWGSTAEEKELFARNAKRQISTWADVNSSLHDYAHKEWAGILTDLYKLRWKLFFDHLLADLKGEKTQAPDFFSVETEWVNSGKEYSETPQGDEIEEVNRLYNKYFN